MLESSARLLALLGLMQSRRDWTGPELAERLGVTDRTIRKDVDRLRLLGYPVDAVRGPHGHYQLGVGASLPPLLLDEEEAVAVAVGLRAATGITGIEETSARALAKLDSVLPHHLQRQVTAMHEAVIKGPENTGSNVEDPVVDAPLLTALAAAIRDHEEVRFVYRDDARLQVEPYRLVSWQRRWYLVARDAHTDTVGAVPRRLAGAENPWGTAVPAGTVPRRLHLVRAARGRRRRLGGPLPGPGGRAGRGGRSPGSTRPSAWSNRSTTTTATSSPAATASRSSRSGSACSGLDFHVDEPPELVEALRVQARRYAAAVPG